MAGAVSAGAYTAGVMDYLIETLDKWEAAKERNKTIGEGNEGYHQSVPMHDVVIEVLSGASAGGMTAALTAVALHGELPPITEGSTTEEKKKNILYNTWVNMVEGDLIEKLLDTSDMPKKQQPRSVLNSSFIEEIAGRAFGAVTSPKPPPLFVSKNLDLFLSLSNLTGTKYAIRFQNEDRHEMCLHQDLVHFVLNGTDTSPDYRIPLRLKTNTNVGLLKDSAIATGAFPLAFPPGEIEKQDLDIGDNPIFDFAENQDIALRSSDDQSEEKKDFCVDAGLINNEPFGITQRLLKKKGGDSAVIMIDPFPAESKECGKKGGDEKNLLDIIGLIIKAVVGQLRFKLDHIRAAVSSKVFDIYMVAPRSRRRPAHPLATGPLEGFAGFFHRPFREKDFNLGRKNCQSFLRKYFALPMDEYQRIFGPVRQEVRLRYEPEGNRGHLPIIPDMDFSNLNPGGNEIIEEEFPEFQTDGLKKKYKKKLKKRSLTLLKRLGACKGSWFRVILCPFLPLILNGGVNWVFKKIEEELGR